MTREEALDFLVSQETFFNFYAQALYVPRAMEDLMGQITLAYSTLNPEWKASNCSGCGGEMIRDANRYRLQRLKDLGLKHYTFPKQ